MNTALIIILYMLIDISKMTCFNCSNCSNKDCIKCNPGFYLSLKSCVACSLANCQKCSSKTTCNTCNKGYSLTTQKDCKKSTNSIFNEFTSNPMYMYISVIIGLLSLVCCAYILSLYCSKSKRSNVVQVRKN